MIAEGKIRVKPLISAVAPLRDGPAWFDRLHSGEPNLMKVVLDPRIGSARRYERKPVRSERSGALVTGASRGLGQYFARALARAGADLILTSRKQADLTPFVSEIEALGRRALPLELDVRDQGSIERMAAAAEQACGQVHILVQQRWMQCSETCTRCDLG